jgi:maleamate amidohydrolase
VTGAPTAVRSDVELVEEVRLALDKRRRVMAERGFGGRVGMGVRPALLVIDLVNGFTDPEAALGADLTAEIEATNRLLDEAHARDLPVVFSTVAYAEPQDDAGSWSRKIAGNDALLEASDAVALDPRLHDRNGDQLLVKTHASCLSGTTLAEDLRALEVDTLVITGCTTSGCVRATAVDASSLGLRPIVVSDAVGDRAPLSHVVSLFDLEMKYADVVTTDEALTEFRRGG